MLDEDNKETANHNAQENNYNLIKPIKYEVVHKICSGQVNIPCQCINFQDLSNDFCVLI